MTNDKKKKFSKHRIAGKHSLKYDAIFKGKKDEAIDEATDYCTDFSIVPYTFKTDPTSAYHSEKYNQLDSVRMYEMKNKIYDILDKHTELNLLSTRRKPSRKNFNDYFRILLNNLDMKNFTYTEIFIEFSYYFSENIENMFRLLEPEFGGFIASELKEKSKNFTPEDIDEIDFQ